MALDTIYTSATYNAYSDIPTMDNAIALIASERADDAGWSAKSDTDKEYLIINATKYTDTLEWYGLKNPDIIVPQRTQPREYLFYPDGTPVDSTIIAPEIIDLMACSIMAVLKAIGEDSNSSPIKKQKVGDVEVEFAVSSASGGYITDQENCPARYLPKDWFENILELGGIGRVGLKRLP